MREIERERSEKCSGVRDKGKGRGEGGGGRGKRGA